ncbi:MAG TPA: sigma 54-interacting transcriptional regulator [Myxococcota bacterium]|nr:sigma 54-interacting transcriptional regulator [Myxococcota bacterium]
MAPRPARNPASSPPTVTLQLFPGPSERPAALEYARAMVELVAGPGADASVAPGPAAPARQAEVGREGLEIGSHPSNGLRLVDDSVSKFHARVLRAPEGFVLEDAGSTNGVFMGEHRVLRAVLANGSAFQVGRCTLRLRVVEGRGRVELHEEDFFGGLIGRHVAMRELFVLLARAARAEATVLLEGETGTGKELAARALHAHSARAAGPFEVLDCGAIPGNLLEAEVFGHRRGAFTGAEESVPGVFERAGGGTVFLDEVGELPLELQPKLLRVLEERTVRRLGDAQVRQCDVRVVAATNRDLRRMVADGRFREDLYHRLAVVRLRIPALRERKDDVALLSLHFLQRALGGANVGGQWVHLLVASFDRLKAHDWPGNVRELRNVIERAVVLADPAALTGDDAARCLAELTEGLARSLIGEEPLRQAKARFEREYLEAALRRTGGHVRRAAEIAGVHQKSFERLLRRYGILREQSDENPKGEKP